jgi:hypothetical protein
MAADVRQKRTCSMLKGFSEISTSKNPNNISSSSKRTIQIPASHPADNASFLCAPLILIINFSE